MFSDDLERRVDDSPDFEKNVAEILHHRHRWRWRFLWIWMAIFTIAVAIGIRQNRERASESRKLGVQNSKFAIQNRERINDVQAARLESCVRGYTGFEIIVKEILPKPTTAAGRKFFRRLHIVVNQLQKKCPSQTGVKTGEK